MKERFGLEALDAGEVQTAGDLYLTCNTGEEGLGDLKGMKTFVADMKDKVKALVALGDQERPAGDGGAGREGLTGY